jgi:hypothetical protein
LHAYFLLHAYFVLSTYSTRLADFGILPWSVGETMPRPLRAELFDPNDVGIVHCIQRCVRRAFLAGENPVTGKNYASAFDRLGSLQGNKVNSAAADDTGGGADLEAVGDRRVGMD